MQKDMYKDAKRLMRAAYEPGLARLTLKHANIAQVDELGESFPQYFKVASTGRVSFSSALGPNAEEPASAKTPVKPTATTIVGTGIKKGVILGGYGHEAAAQRECDQFMHPNVFTYQSAIFPDPRSHSVQVKVTRAVPVKLKQPSTPLYPWGVKLELMVEGKITKASAWCDKFDARIRTQAVK
jgi:hypothetical protein